ncbi:hypothetical protein U1Q18_032398 [Sarracenia purpurea var. burkii]
MKTATVVTNVLITFASERVDQRIALKHVLGDNGIDRVARADLNATGLLVGLLRVCCVDHRLGSESSRPGTMAHVRSLRLT